MPAIYLGRIGLAGIAPISVGGRGRPVRAAALERRRAAGWSGGPAGAGDPRRARRSCGRTARR